MKSTFQLLLWSNLAFQLFKLFSTNQNSLRPIRRAIKTVPADPEEPEATDEHFIGKKNKKKKLVKESLCTHVGPDRGL